MESEVVRRNHSNGASPALHLERTSEAVPAPGPKPFPMSSALAGISKWSPERVVTSEELVEEVAPFLGIPHPDFLRRITGVKERRFCAEGADVVDVAMNAVRALEEQVDLVADRIDALIYAGITRAYMEPATAAVISRRIGLAHASAFDVTNACLGFIDAMMLADALIQGKQAEQVLIVSAELGLGFTRRAVDLIKRGGALPEHLAALTLGDGAVAALMTAGGPASKGRFTSGIRASFTECSDACIIEDASSPLAMDYEALFSNALYRIPQLYEPLMRYEGWEAGAVDLAVPHQPSLKIIRQAAALVGVPQEHVAVTLDRFGNMGSVSVPFTLAAAFEDGRLSPGDRVLLAGFGSGLGISMMCMYA